MRRVFLLLIVGITVVTLAWYLAALSGHVSVSVGRYDIETSVPVALLAAVLLALLFGLVLRVVFGIGLIPGLAGRWRRNRRLRLGQQALNRVLVALAAGDPADARKQAQRARRLLGDTPQTLQLLAESGRLDGREDLAQEAFTALTQIPDGAFLGYRGLLRQAIDQRDWTAAIALARQAEKAHPGTPWLRQQRAELALQTDNWIEALDLIGADPRRVVYRIAAAAVEQDPKRALDYARQAWKEDPGFAPATVAYASRLRAAGQESRARSAIVDAWARAPHPDLAALLLAPETTKLARLQAAKRLTEHNPAHAESRLLIAQTALDADVTGEARMQLQAAQQAGV